MKCVIYRRVSSDEQTKGFGLDRQLELAEQLAAEQGLLVQQVYTDNGKSAHKGEHTAIDNSGNPIGQLAKLYDDIDKGVIQKGTILIVEDLDRLSRQEPNIAMGELTTQLINKGVEVWTFLDGLTKYNVANELGILMAFIKQKLAHDESKKKSERGLASHANKRILLKNGQAPKIRRPFWIDLVNNEYVLNEKASIVKTIFELSLLGYGRINIAKQLNDQGIKPIGWKHDSNRTNEWNDNKVSKILRSPSVMGDWHSEKHDETIREVFPQVISRNDYYKVQTLARKNPRTQSTQKIDIFQTMLTCPYCNAKYSRRSVLAKGKYYYSYKCTNSQLCAASSQVSERLFDGNVLKYLADLDWSFMDRGDNTAELNAGLLELQDEQKVLQESIKKRATKEKLDKLDMVEIEIERIEAQLANTAIDIDTEFDHGKIINGDREIRVKTQHALKLLIERIEVWSVGSLPNELAKTLPDKFDEIRKIGKQNNAHAMIYFKNGEKRQVGLSSEYVASNRYIWVE